MARTVTQEQLPFSPRKHRAREIRWHPWGHHAFQLAQRADKPILLCLTAWWCEQCHQMDETSYSDQQVIDRIKNSFVPIRVDTDRRPDVNDRYTLGEWPTVALLAPTGELLTSAGHLPPEELAALLTQVAGWYETQAADLRQEIVDMEARRRQLLRYPFCPPDQPPPELLENVASMLEGLYDPLYGGFGDQPKFPYPDAVSFALRRSQAPGGERWAEIADRSLEAIATRLLDHVDGGFFRSAARRDWTQPHTEKLLEVNADLLSLYLDAYQATGKGDYRTVVERVLDFLNATLRNEDTPTFGESQSADSEYYQLAGRDREKVEQPDVDRTVIAEGNGKAAVAYLLAYRLPDHADHLRTATQLLDFLWTRMTDPQRGVARYWDGQPAGPYLLRDQLSVGTALAEAYDVTGDDRFLEKATILAEVILRDYAGVPGGFYDLRAEPDALGGLADRGWNLVENAQVARLMVRLAGFGGNGRYLEAARSALQLFAQDYSRFGALAGSYALALEEYLQGKT